MLCCQRQEQSTNQQTVIEQVHRNNEIDQEIEEEKVRNCYKVKLLLLGPGESGKSTVVKQMKLMHDKMSKTDYKRVKYTIYANIYTSMANIINAMSKLGITFEYPQRKEDAQAVFDVIEHEEHFTEPPKLVLEAMEKLWADGGIQKCYERRAEYQLNDCAKYFLDQLYRIGAADYVPNTQDMLYARIRTSGINEIIFSINTLEFTVIDVGGQQSERRKWIHCFDNVNSVIFVADIASFNQQLREDNETNRLIDCLQLFAYVFNNQYFSQSSMILFLNKIDIFAEKLQAGVSIKNVFLDYQGSQEYEECYSFIKLKFLELNEVRELSDLYVHPTCATDTKQVQTVLLACQDMIVSKNMSSSGLG